MKHAIVIPAIHRGNTLGFLASLDPDVARKRVVLIDNTKSGALFEDFRGDVAFANAQDRNQGVAASWNNGAKLAFDLGATFVTFASTSMRFHDGGRALTECADFAADHDQWQYGFESLNGWHLITLGRRTFDEVGYFDEEFWPAYFEDNDYIWRLRCAGILEPAGGDRSLRKIPWVPSLNYECVGNAHAVKNCGIKVDNAKLLAYYERKWLGPPGEEKTETPFGGKP